MNLHTERYDRLHLAGHAVYGDDWQSPMARDLGITGRHLRRWVAGERPVPAWVDGMLAGILKQAAAASAGRAVALEPVGIAVIAGRGGLTCHRRHTWTSTC